MKFQQVIDRVPDYKSFLTLDEMDESTKKLAEEFPDIVTVFEAGKSRKGHPILCIKIGSGPKNALCFACPHPNEPIGAMTMEFFSRALAEDKALCDELGFTWYIIKCIDPDGVRLNENWFKGPYNIYNYNRNYFRPAGYEQVEWTFPIDYKDLHFHSPMPETETLMKIIDETLPEFMYSLHNTGFGGAYWYITHDFPELYEGLYNSAKKQGVALSLGEAEAPYLIEFAPAIFKALSITHNYDYMEKFTGKAPKYDSGTSSFDYALTKVDCVTLLTELPYFFDARVQDLSETNMTRKQVIVKNVEMTDTFYAILQEILSGIRPYISGNNPFVKLVDQIAQHTEANGEAKKNWADSSPEFDKPATVSQAFDNDLTARFFNGLSLALTVRTCEFELERLGQEGSQDGHAVEKLKKALETGSDLLIKHCEELERDLNYTVIPIQKLVRIQLESGLIVASHVTGRE